MPPVHESLEIAGGLRPSLAGELGLPAGLPVTAGTGAAAAVAGSTRVGRGGLIGLSIERGGSPFAPLADAIPRPHGRLERAPGAGPLWDPLNWTRRLAR